METGESVHGFPEKDRSFEIECEFCRFHPVIAVQHIVSLVVFYSIPKYIQFRQFFHPPLLQHIFIHVPLSCAAHLLESLHSIGCILCSSLGCLSHFINRIIVVLMHIHTPIADRNIIPRLMLFFSTSVGNLRIMDAKDDMDFPLTFRKHPK